MTPRTGRPIKGEEPRDQSIHIRITKTEKELLEECAQKTQMTITNTFIKGLRLLSEELDK